MYYCPNVCRWRDQLQMKCTVCVPWGSHSSRETSNRCPTLEGRGSLVKAVGSWRNEPGYWERVVASHNVGLVGDFESHLTCCQFQDTGLTLQHEPEFHYPSLYSSIASYMLGVDDTGNTKINEAWMEIPTPGRSLLLKSLHCFLHCHRTLKNMSASNTHLVSFPESRLKLLWMGVTGKLFRDV